MFQNQELNLTENMRDVSQDTLFNSSRLSVSYFTPLQKYFSLFLVKSKKVKKKKKKSIQYICNYFSLTEVELLIPASNPSAVLPISQYNATFLLLNLFFCIMSHNPISRYAAQHATVLMLPPSNHDVQLQLN